MLNKLYKDNLTFKDTLKEFDETELPVIKVLVADEVRFGLQRFEDEISDDDYETLCGFIYNEILESDVNECAFIYATLDCLEEKKFEITDITSNSDAVADIIYQKIEDKQY